jgi:hypothetical protein
MRALLVALLVSGCYGHGSRHCRGYTNHHYYYASSGVRGPGALGALELALDFLDAVGEVGDAVDAANRVPASSEPQAVSAPIPPPAAPLTGTVLWSGFPGQFVSSVLVVLEGPSGLTLRAVADGGGRFEFPAPLPPGQYRVSISDRDIVGSAAVYIINGGVPTVVVPAELRAP